MITNPEISVIIPVYNEGAHIVESLKTINQYIKGATKSYEIIVIDDGSSDDTWINLNQIIKLIPNVWGIRLSRNFGKEFALSAGLEQSAGNAVIIMDADLQHPPSLIPEMISVWREQKVGIVECVKRERGKESLRNRLGAKLFYRLLKNLTGYNLRGASDFKLLDQRVVQAWAQMREKSIFFRGMTAWLGFKKAKIEFDVAERVNGETKWNVIKLTKLAVNAVVSFTSLPLRFVSFAGLSFFVAAIIMGLQTLYNKMTGSAVTGFTTVILLQLIIGSVVMISLGVIGEYIAAIYNEVKGRPRYLIQETLTAEQLNREPKYEENELVKAYG